MARSPGFTSSASRFTCLLLDYQILPHIYPRHSTKRFPQNAAVLHAYYWIRSAKKFPQNSTRLLPNAKWPDFIKQIPQNQPTDQSNQQFPPEYCYFTCLDYQILPNISNRKTGDFTNGILHPQSYSCSVWFEFLKMDIFPKTCHFFLLQRLTTSTFCKELLASIVFLFWSIVIPSSPFPPQRQLTAK